MRVVPLPTSLWTLYSKKLTNFHRTSEPAAIMPSNRISAPNSTIGHLRERAGR